MFLRSKTKYIYQGNFFTFICTVQDTQSRNTNFKKAFNKTDETGLKKKKIQLNLMQNEHSALIFVEKLKGDNCTLENNKKWTNIVLFMIIMLFIITICSFKP